MIRSHHNLALAPLTTFGVAGTVAQAWTIGHADEIEPVLAAAAKASEASQGAVPFLLGGGSNVLFARDLAEPMILMRIRGRQLVHDDGNEVMLDIGAGEVWDEIVDWTLSQGWFGLENLALIPGRMGGAPWQNIGAYGLEAAERIAAVEAVDVRSGTHRLFDKAECRFGYRSSFFKAPAGRQWLITRVRLRLSRQPDLRTSYGEILEELAKSATTTQSLSPSPLQVATSVRAIRRRKLPDPGVIGNAGSFFKNPTIDLAALAPLRSAFPRMPAYPVVDEPTRVKLSAGWLIEAAGWKGYRDGDAGVSDRHALVLVNHGRASGAQILALARRIQQSVLEQFGVALEPEPVILE